MAWDPNEPGNYAWLSTEASKHDGPEQYIQDIHDDGYQEGYDDGEKDGAKEAVIALAILYGGYRLAKKGYKSIKNHIQSQKDKKQLIEAKSEYAKDQILDHYQADEPYLDEENSRSIDEFE